MAKGRNLVILVGNLGAEAQMHYAASGNAIATISVATSESWKDKQTGEQQERTEWHRCKAFGRLAEIIGEYGKKGRQVYIEGKLRTEKYQKDGVDHFSTNIVIDEFQLLGSDPARNTAQPESRRPSAPASNGSNGHAPAPRTNGASYPPPNQHQQHSGPVTNDASGWNDEAPF